MGSLESLRNRRALRKTLGASFNEGLMPTSQNVCTLSRVEDFESQLGSTQTEDNSTADELSETSQEIMLSQKACLVLEATRSFKRFARFHELEDLQQEGFLFLCEALQSGEFDELQSNECLFRKIKNHLRGKRIDQNSLTKLRVNLKKSGLLNENHIEITEIELELLYKCIDRALEKLTLAQRETIALCYGLVGESKKIDDIAAMQGKTPRAVRKLRKLGQTSLVEDLDLESLAS